VTSASPFRQGHDGFIAFCGAVGLRLEPFQRRIARAAFGPEPELLVLLPRGNGKTTLMAALAVHHLLTVEDPAVYSAAASRDQARVLYEAARAIAEHPAVDGQLTLRHLELRAPRGHLRVLASDARLAHGLSPTLSIVDELHAHRDGELYIAMRSALPKRPGARMVTISTAGSGAESPLGRLRARALAAPKIKHSLIVTDARADGLRMLQWAVPDERVHDLAAYVQANPASWITRDALRTQRAALPALAFQRYHGNVWTAKEGAWLPPGTWQACVGDPRLEPGEEVWIGVDVGGTRAATAVVWCSSDLRVGCWIGHGDEAILEAVERVRDLAATFRVRELIYDPWRFGQAALELEREGMVVVAFPQTDARMVPASAALHEVIVHGRITLPDHHELAEHAANAVQRHSRRGWRLDSPSRGANIDAIVALAMAVERAQRREPAAQLVGWL